MRAARDYFQAFHGPLPPWVTWTVPQWQSELGAGLDCRRFITDCLGWDITDFRTPGVKLTFAKRGLVLVTVVNTLGHCLKLMFTQEGQVTPAHIHPNNKRETIGVFGGGYHAKLAMRLWRMKHGAPLRQLRTGQLERWLDFKSEVVVRINGMTERIPAGARFILNQGENITLPPYLCHEFAGYNGSCALFEDSTKNNDLRGNAFRQMVERFCGIKEDELALYPLWNEVALLRPITQIKPFPLDTCAELAKSGTGLNPRVIEVKSTTAKTRASI
jgi:D-lyxose ketol-isomerase